MKLSVPKMFLLNKFRLSIFEVAYKWTHPAFRTAPVQLNDAAAVPVAFALYGEAITLSPSSSSDTAVVKLIRSSSEICKMEIKRQKSNGLVFAGMGGVVL